METTGLIELEPLLFSFFGLTGPTCLDLGFRRERWKYAISLNQIGLDTLDALGRDITFLLGWDIWDGRSLIYIRQPY